MELWYHVDVNSAFLSWSAAYEVHHLGADRDLRDAASVIGGNEKNRRGIVLAKSEPAKAYGIKTGEPLSEARRKCPGLLVVPPDYELYVDCSAALIRLLKQYSPQVHQYSIDEAFCSMEGTVSLWGSPVAFAHQLREEIQKTLGFTVNIGVSDCKLLSKMASEFQKPNRVHTLFTEEIRQKLWPLPIEDLFWVGHSAGRTLRNLGIRTIGELAHSDPHLVKKHLKKHGEFLWNYAHGRDISPFLRELPQNKGYGNSMTLPFDVTDRETAHQAILSLTETVCARLRAGGMKTACVSISIKDLDFIHSSRQTVLPSPTDTTLEIYRAACRMFDSLWNLRPVRQLGVHTGRAVREAGRQYNLFDLDHYEKYSKLDQAIDEIRARYGEDSIMRASFLDHRLPHMGGGIDKAKRTGMTKAPFTHNSS